MSARYPRIYPHSAAGRPTPEPAPATAWRLLPGGVLELGATGYAIQLHQERQRMPYTLRDPEGRAVAFGMDLQSLKGVGEKLARDRREFQA